MAFKDIAKKVGRAMVNSAENQMRRIDSDINRASKYGSQMSDDRLKEKYKNASTAGERYGYAKELKKRGY